MLAAGRLPADELITGRAALEEAQSLFERLESPVMENIKILLSPETTLP